MTSEREAPEPILTEGRAMESDDDIGKALNDFRQAVEVFERQMLAADAYMPSLATSLRIHADELADKYPDDTNGGRTHD
jgi:hypothetical protein